MSITKKPKNSQTLKLVSLNLWGGRRGKILSDFLQREAATADIFCFQEVFDSSSKILSHRGARTHLFVELKTLLPGFKAYFAPCYSGWMDEKKVDFKVTEGQAVFIKKTLLPAKAGTFYIYGSAKTKISTDFKNEPRNAQWVSFKAGGKKLMVLNVHGMWYPGEKLDTPDRLRQSLIIRKFLHKRAGLKIVCGDFNLMPGTKSLKMLEGELRNLIKTFKIKSTRNRLSWQKHSYIQHFADYIFVSPKIKVKNFQVPYNEISDHLPMIAEFELS